MTLRSMIPALALAAAVGAGLPAAAQTPEGDLAKVLPRDTLGVLSVRDLSRVFSLDEDGALMRLLEHDAVKTAFEELYESFDWLEDKDVMLALDLEPREIARMLNGRLTLALPELYLEETEVETRGGGTEVRLELEPSGGFSLMADVDVTADKLEEVLENIATLWGEEENLNRVQLLIEEFEGMKVYHYEVEDNDGDVDEPFRLALRDGLLVASNEKDTVEDLLDRLKNGAPEGERLADEPAYAETLDRLGDSDLLLYFNVEQLGPMVNTLIAHEMADMPDEYSQYVTADNLLAALGIDALWSVFGGLTVEDDEATLVFGFTHEDRERGLATLIAYDDRGVEIPEYFHPDLHSASVSSFDFGTLYRNAMDMLQKASPYAHLLVTTQLSNLEGSGYPLRDALLENTDGFLAEMLGYPEGVVPGPDDHPTQAYVMRVRDAQTLSEALVELGEMMSEDDPREYMNETIYEIPLPFMLSMGTGAGKAAFSVVENYLVVALGDPRMVESVIGHIKNPGQTILDDDALMTALDDMPDEDVVGLGWANVADVLTNTIRASRDAIEMQIRFSDGDERATFEEARDALEEIPDVSDIDYFIATKTYRTPESFVAHMLLRRKG